jgi:hypothetical protein
LYQDLAAAGAIPAGGPLPPVLPIVLYNGQDAWTATTSLADLLEPDLPEQLRHWQPQIRYLLLEERRYAEAELAGLRNVAAALFRLENSRAPADLERVVASLVDWLRAPEQTALRRAFVVWLKRVLLPARVPGADIPHVIELQEMQAMLAERVKTWTEEWKQQGLQQGLQQQAAARAGRPPARRSQPVAPPTRATLRTITVLGRATLGSGRGSRAGVLGRPGPRRPDPGGRVRRQIMYRIATRPS